MASVRLWTRLQGLGRQGARQVSGRRGWKHGTHHQQPPVRHLSAANSHVNRADNTVRCPFPDAELLDNVPLAHYMLDDFGRYGDRVAMVRYIYYTYYVVCIM